MARTALVTGGNRGIGLAIVEGLARDGLEVILGARDKAKGDEAAEALQRTHGLRVEVLELDVGDPASIESVAPTVADRVDVLVNNAGILPDGNLMTMPWEDIEASTRVNALGPLQLMRALVPAMADRGYGRVVNVSSGWGSLHGLGPGAYGVTKAYLNAITVKAAGEAPRSVLINAMCPGWVRTSMGGPGATLSAAEGADTAIYLAQLPDGGPRGRLFRDRRPVPWDE
ncbi:MAG: SDR family NAD(P)-dependent oxidoreductase [Devosiaceae bacterium]|nr:SDR family NAD(P)-dependent oxidoreductase [Devosiaceae bacterium MH13]